MHLPLDHNILSENEYVHAPILVMFYMCIWVFLPVLGQIWGFFYQGCDEAETE